MEVTSIIAKNRTQDKPNEDNFWVDAEKKVFLVVDGVSRDRVNGIYPNPSPSATLADDFVKFCKLHYEDNLPLETLFQNANEEINKINQSFIDYFKPCLVALIIRIQADIVEWVSIGDCFGLLIRNNNAKIFNTKQTEKLRKSKEKFDSKTIRTEICNNPDHPLAYGVLDGNPKANSFIEYGKFNIEHNDIICIFSDGLEMFADPKLTEIILNKNVNEIITLAEQIEMDENIRSDDKVIIKIKI